MGETTKSRSARTRRSGNGALPRANGSKTANGSSRRLAPGSDSLERALVDASVDCVIAFDPTGRVVEWNPAAEMTFGYSRERALGADVVELMVPPDKHELERGRLRQIAASPPPSGARAEREGIRANGERFPIEVTITCIETPEPVIVTLVRDISRDRVKARRQAALSSLANQVLRGAPLEDLGIAVAVMVREELPAEVVRIWHRPPAGEEQELVAVAGDDGAGSYPPAPASEEEAGVVELEDGVAFRISMPNAPAIAIALHGGAGLVADDLALLESSCQLLISSASLNGTVEALADAERRYRGLIERLPVVSYLADYGPVASGRSSPRRSRTCSATAPRSGSAIRGCGGTASTATIANGCRPRRSAARRRSSRSRSSTGSSPPTGGCSGCATRAPWAARSTAVASSSRGC